MADKIALIIVWFICGVVADRLFVRLFETSEVSSLQIFIKPGRSHRSEPVDDFPVKRFRWRI